MSKCMFSASFFRSDLSDRWNTYENAGLYLLKEGLEIETPAPDLHLIDVPGRTAPLDLTEALLAGYIHYKTRTITMRLAAVQKAGSPPVKWQTLCSSLLSRLHGQRLRCVLSNDPQFYYEGRWTVDFRQRSRWKADVTITGICDPYKVDLETGERSL